MILYLLKSTLCLGLFLSFYHFLLSNEKMHVFNRIYLLASVVVAASIPLITFTETEIFTQTLAAEEGMFSTVFVISDNINDKAMFWDKYIQLFIVIYTTITGILLLKFIRNILVIKQQIKSNVTFKYKEAKLVLMDKRILPYTFMQYIFLDKKAYHQNEIEEELLIHELAHVKQKHSLDLLFAEFLKVFLWFNPLLFIYKKMMQLNHEFLADDAVINTSNNNITDYQYLLLAKVSSNKHLMLTSNLNYLLTKKRFIMMSKKSSDLIIFLKKVAIIPLTICFVLLFSQKTLAQNTGISDQSMDTYKSEMKKMLKEGKGTFKVDQKDAKKLNYLFNNMSEEQKKKMKKQGLILPPPPPPAPKPPVVSTPHTPGVPPPPPPAPKAHVGDAPKIAPPPPPPAPLEHIKDLAKKGAKFYYNGKSISSKGAIKLVKHTQGLHVSVKDLVTGEVVVKLSNKPTVIHKEE